jgi:hypothetical protein
MKARPILFSGPMVRALLAGTKAQTRRIVKPQPANDPAKHHPIEPYCSSGGAWNWVLAATGRGTGDPFPCPYGVPGDLLWVRESMQRQPGGWAYMADGGDVMAHRNKALEVVSWAHHYGGKSAPSIHMPRWASRLTLEITDVRVERLQDISEEDAEAEGVERGLGLDTRWRDYAVEHLNIGWMPTPRESYRTLWSHINGLDSWIVNPWVWAVSFKVHRQNVDAFFAEVAA